jgi:hypothetical protein
MDICKILGVYSKKQITSLFTVSKNWHSFMLIESMLQTSIRKGFMAANAQERSTRAAFNTTLNGNYIGKKSEVYSDADVFVITREHLLAKV